MGKDLTTNKEYRKWLTDIKGRIRSSQQRAALKVNQELLGLYWYIGQALATKQTEWGDKFIDHLARDLKVEFPDVQGFSKRNLQYMRRWYSFYNQDFVIVQQLVAQLELSPDYQIAQQAVAQISDKTKKTLQGQTDVQNGQQSVDLKLNSLLLCIPWGHHIVILTKIKSLEEAVFYVVKTIQNNWSRSILQAQIESELYKRQGKALTNFQLTLPAPQSDLAQQMLKNLYNFDFLTLAEDAQEREFERALIQHIKRFLLELGKGFAYVGNQYNMNVEGDEFFLDLLFFNYNLNRFIIFELKVGDFKPEYPGKLNMYINTVNEQIKLDNHQPTIGVLLCKTPNKTVIEYSIKNINAPMGISDYKIKKALPKELKLGMPTMKELEHELEKEIEVTQNPLEQKLQKLKSIIRSNTKEEAKKARDKKVVRQIVDQLFLPLIKKVTSKTETEIKPLYHKAELTYWIDGSGQPERDVFLKELEKSGTPRHVRVEYRFDGFKSAGLKAFNNRLEFQIEFEDFKYTVHCGHHNKGFTPVEKLYHHKITAKEIDDIANKLVEVLLDEVNEYAERNMKD